MLKDEDQVQAAKGLFYNYLVIIYTVRLKTWNNLFEVMQTGVISKSFGDCIMKQWETCTLYMFMVIHLELYRM